ncbi:DNA-3-methyladenine glycosylase 2 [Achromobacter denitrificans]|uniref:DNA-3-methyladenine glycosylase II n=4 Tax=Achromobacter denitrificans TaxID=32002 RepID=A0A6J5CLK9_ACHDE|nr:MULTISPECIES: AlkA N-terminal domain-containing protein [Achromobacter]OLU03867.1 3-methyladenine DNA glycosylase 2 [Achromobacter denitrificans]QKH42970.1 helix-turn-helix domain-containing protein [Achromobacter denitrificans]QKH49888.1 helix-turn-helix domain-containing protein [Achromobacter denitrificans]QKQ45736.1 helix-turn-helix domain-containing protein [Achromobacter denitrificans]CAB3738386.1 putative bifunctional transcriptional activator/DNA repair enzyme AlkA [Achromobacter de
MDLNHDACYSAIQVRDARYDGRFFTAVKTTGIYCRPVCPARTPLSRNVTFYATAAAAQEAGYHPCLRCRPETAPELGPGHELPAGVARALQLIELGALDEEGVDALARRLGVGERQLRRQFRQHLGASPVAVAQTRRVLLAKQLIHETRLPMAEVAFASGFGSIRRFNEIFHHLFGRAPGELRRSEKPELPAGSDGEIKLLLRYRPPYDWESMLAFLRLRAIPGVERVTDDTYARAISLDGHQGTVTLRPGTGNALQAIVRFPRLQALPAIIARLRRVFDLASDPVAIAAQFSRDPVMTALIQARPGLRVPGAWDGFELALRAVLGQQITVAAAVRLAGKLVAAHGAPLARPDGELTHVFPEPEVVAAAELASLGMPRSRAATLSAVAAAAVADKHLFDAGGDLAESVLRLRAIRGVGEWTAQYIALRQLREPDAFPSADIGLIRAMERLESRAYTPAQLLARAEAWRPWRAYAAQHLWTA